MTTCATDENSIRTLLSEASECSKRADYHAARARLEAIVSQEPQNEIALGMLAAVHAELKQFDRAISLFEQVLAVNRDNALARFQLGLILLDLERPHDALATWQPGRYRDSEYLVDYYRGIALLQLDRPIEAVERLQQARLMMPTDHVLYPQLLAHLIQHSQSS